MRLTLNLHFAKTTQSFDGWSAAVVREALRLNCMGMSEN
jgi:hypothetical protein